MIPSRTRQRPTSPRISPLYILCFFLLFITVKAREEPLPDKFIGIQIGSTYSRVGVIQNGTLEVFTNSHGNRVTPTHVVYTDQGFLVGEAARDHPGPNLFDAVADMNRLFNITSNTTQTETNPSQPYRIISHAKRPRVVLEINNTTRTFTPEEIYAPILVEMRNIAELHIGGNITGAVVVVPAPFFEDNNREMIQRAGTLAGLPIQREVRESVSVGIGYALDKSYDDFTFITYDLGGHYLDISLMELDTSVFDPLAVVRARIGGEDFDRRVVDYFATLYHDKHGGVDFREDIAAMDRLMSEVEKAKQALSSETSYHIEIQDFLDGTAFSEVLTRDKFEELNRELLESTLPYLDRVLEEGKLSKADLKQVLLAGGSTQIPLLQEMLANYFPGLEISRMDSPGDAAVWGAAQQAKVLQWDDDMLCTCCGDWDWFEEHFENVDMES